MSHEIKLATNAPHDVVMLDYSLATPIIYFNNATSNIMMTPNEQLRDEFVADFSDGLKS